MDGAPNIQRSQCIVYLSFRLFYLLSSDIELFTVFLKLFMLIRLSQGPQNLRRKPVKAPSQLSRDTAITMPPKINIDSQFEAIRAWIYEEELSLPQIRERLSQEGVRISRATLFRTLSAWGFRINAVPFQDSEALRERIAQIHSRMRLTDAEAARILQRDGFEITARRLQALRLEMGLTRRLNIEQAAAMEQEMFNKLQIEYTDGRIADYGKGHLYAYMRSKYSFIGR